jgi:hypothetical protein
MPENEFYPYKAINIFINRDYLNLLLENILVGVKTLSKTEQIKFSNAFKHHVNVLGFKNPRLAPLPLQIKAFVDAFEKKDEVIPFSLSTWLKINADLADKVLSWLNKEGWEDCTIERDLLEKEGFTGHWSEDLTFDKLFKKFIEEYPDEEISQDDLILMVAWISGKLPYDESGL